MYALSVRMRDPLGPIPSPAASTPHAERFWHPTILPPPPPGTAPDPGPAETGDVLGIDRRQGPRHGDAPLGSAATALDHDPVTPRMLGLRSRYGWSLCRGLAICPTGLLVRGVDLLDPHQGPDDADEARATLKTLAPALGATRRGGTRSFLGLVCGCVLAPRLLEDLAEWGSGLGARRKPTPIPVTLLIPRPDEIAVEGVLAPLNDPQPDVLGIALDKDAVASVRARLQR